MSELKLAPELKTVYLQLKAEGFKVYTYCSPEHGNKDIHSLYWFENGRVLEIQPSSWYNARYARDRFSLHVSYVPSRKTGASCELSSSEKGLPAANLLKYRNHRTWVKGATDYQNMEHFFQKWSLTFYEIEED